MGPIPQAGAPPASRPAAAGTNVLLRGMGALLFGLVARAALAAAPADVAPRVDHHTHLNAPAIQAFLPEFCASMKRFGGCDPALTAPHTPADLLAAMDVAGIRKALLLSDGYLAESPLMQPPCAQGADLLRAANDWTVALARRYPARFGAFIAVDPLRPTALAELNRWRGDPAVAGVKLHLTASGVDLRKDGDVAALAAVVRAAAEARWAVLIHMRSPRSDYGAPDVRRFLAEVLPAAGDTPVQIAHVGGWGGLDPPTLSALGAFAEAIEAQPGRFRHVWFDLSGVWSGRSPPAARTALVALMRRIGIGHFLLASDWPYNGAGLLDYYQRGYPQLPLTKREWAVLRRNVAPYATAR